MTTSAETEAVAWWATPNRVKDADLLLGKLTTSYSDQETPLPVPSAAEQWVLEQACTTIAGQDRRLYVPWMNDLALARLVTCLAYVHGRDPPLLVIGAGPRCRMFMRGLYQRMTPTHHLVETRAWNGERFVSLRRTRKGGATVQCIMVDQTDTVAPALEASGIDEPGLVLWLRLDPALKQPEPVPRSGSSTAVVRLHCTGPPPGERGVWKQLQAFEGPDERPFAWPTNPDVRLYLRQTSNAATRTTIAQSLVDVEDRSLDELAEATRNLIQRNDRSSGIYQFYARMAANTYYEVAASLIPFDEDDLAQVPLLREQAFLIPAHLRDAWTAWVNALESAYTEHLGRRTTKADTFLAVVPGHPEWIVAAPTRAAKQSMLEALRKAGASNNVEAITDLAERRNLRECRASKLPGRLRDAGRFTAVMLGPGRRTDLERICRGLIDEVIVWTYPHEAQRLAALVKNLRFNRLTHSSEKDVVVPSGIEALSEDAMEDLLDWSPAMGGDRPAADNEEDEPETFGLSIERVRIILRDGRTLDPPKYRRFFVWRRNDVNRISAVELKQDDLLIELPAIASTSRDLVHAVFSLSPRFSEVQMNALRWREILAYKYRHWAIQKEEAQEAASMAGFFREVLPTVDVDVQAVRNWLNEHVEMPQPDNLDALLRDLGTPTLMARKISAAQSEYRSLRLRAHRAMASELAAMVKRRMGHGVSLDDDAEDDEVLTEVQELLRGHLAQVRLSQIEKVKRDETTGPADE